MILTLLNVSDGRFLIELQRLSELTDLDNSIYDYDGDYINIVI